MQTEVEFTGLSYALRAAIPIMELLKEMHETVYPVTNQIPTVCCKVFEDSTGLVEICK
jgi:hypothetical protein